ncbi:P-loop NTPase fold protein [uncultured Flavobacterium sp.]|uniref:P-loop NTPase fold protein n=1 Tax=uncultured Flavobacterium sp. TaxID=165435 RepID=UPI00292F9790|nr:P-loop NTPase fold protein [uncultured Flavobacterium sp.]
MEELEKAIKIETSVILSDFKSHLEIENNKRILFSGPFGTGKSTFLNELSKDENQDFFYLKIFPVNYSVSLNEDVFELIKFDLLFQLMGQYFDEIKLKKEDFTLLLKSQVFIMERIKFMPLLYAILGFSEKIGTPIVDFIKALEKTVGDFKEFSDEVKIDEENDIKKFLESIEQRKGNTYEMDAVSELIFDLIVRIKKEKNKKSVLIIDDLDRLDPEHIFRLFNIFSAHYNQVDGNNKFGFDKVIFVCDIENIRKIFHHRYGFDVDFSGYIDKFYSISPFDFDNRWYVKNKIGELLKKLKFVSNLSNYNFEKNEVFYDSTKAIIQTLIDARLLNLRMLLTHPIVIVPEFYFGANDNVSKNSPIIVLFYLLKNFYGSFDILLLKIKSLCELFDRDAFKVNHNNYMKSEEWDINNLITFCLPFLLPEKMTTGNDETEKRYFLKEYDCDLHFKLARRGFSHNYSPIFIKSTRGQFAQVVELNPYRILFDTFVLCKKRAFLK